MAGYGRFVFIAALVLVGCTSVHVTPMKPLAKKEVCIEENDKVIVPGFLDIVRSGFENHGFSTRVYKGDPPDACETLLMYTATRKWDLAPYMTDAELWLRDRSGKRLGYAQYHLNGGGGLALNKWASTESKMAPVIDRLLSAYPR